MAAYQSVAGVATLSDRTDITRSTSVAVASPAGGGTDAGDDPPLRVRTDADSDLLPRRRGAFGALIRRRESASVREPGLLELFSRTLDVVQETVTRLKLAAQPPDLLITIPRNVCTFYDFHRAEEVIELGRLRTRESLAHWLPLQQRPRRPQG